uniref:UNC93-like protein MFSD11 n=1 Tax=Angiostrongylus cantonensis TaxID=6313 RepID=A0A158P8C0_ANGCA
MDRQSWRELVCILCLSIATMCLMNGYDTQSFIVEAVLHSVHMREPTRIAKHAGYYGQAVLYGTYAAATVFAPWICLRLGSNWSLLVGSFLFTTYHAGFFMLNSHFYYLSQAFNGIGFAYACFTVYYSGQGLYISEHSTRATITRNSSLVSSIGNSSMLLGGFVLFVIFYVSENLTEVFKTAGNVVATNYRNFLDAEIYAIYGVLLTVTVISNIIFTIMLTMKARGDKLEPIEKSTLRSQLGHFFNTACEPKMLLLSFFFIFYGFHVSFWLGAYPTTFAFSKALSSNIYLPAFYSGMVGLGNIIGTFNVQYGEIVCCILGILHGMIDCCSCSMRSLICTMALPRKRLQAYSLAKLYQSMASCAAYFLSPHLTVMVWIAILAGSQILSAVGFFVVSREISCEDPASMDRPTSVQKINPIQDNYIDQYNS